MTLLLGRDRCSADSEYKDVDARHNSCTHLTFTFCLISAAQDLSSSPPHSPYCPFFQLAGHLIRNSPVVSKFFFHCVLVYHIHCSPTVIWHLSNISIYNILHCCRNSTTRHKQSPRGKSTALAAFVYDLSFRTHRFDGIFIRPINSPWQSLRLAFATFSRLSQHIFQTY